MENGDKLVVLCGDVSAPGKSGRGEHTVRVQNTLCREMKVSVIFGRISEYDNENTETRLKQDANNSCFLRLSRNNGCGGGEY